VKVASPDLTEVWKRALVSATATGVAFMVQGAMPERGALFEHSAGSMALQLTATTWADVVIA